MDRILNIYILYTKQDAGALSSILERLQPAIAHQDITIWYDDPIQEGQSWIPKEAARLHKTDLFVLLLSNAFMYSEFVQQMEFKTVIDRYKEGISTVIPVILEDCPWDVEFNSDEYDFSFKELVVIPADGRPIKQSTNPEQYYEQVAHTINKALGLFVDESESIPVVDEEALPILEEEQLAMHFSEEPQVAIENQELVETKENETKIAQETERKQWELKAQREAEAVERQQQEETEKQALEEQRIREELAAEEARQREIAAAQSIEAQEQRPSQFADREVNKGEEVATKGRGRRRMLIGLLIAVLGIIGVWIFSTLSDDTKKPSVAIPEENPSRSTKATTTSEPKTDVSIDEELSPVLNLQLGDMYEGGTIFHLDASGEGGKIAHTQDVGPMSWKRAMAIQEQLGAGWRLPTLEELKQMYRTIGPGGTNSGKFSSKLYWSATPYETYQARLLQFRDGNSSYHYNKEVESRQFLVRAVRDF